MRSFPGTPRAMSCKHFQEPRLQGTRGKAPGLTQTTVASTASCLSDESLSVSPVIKVTHESFFPGLKTLSNECRREQTGGCLRRKMRPGKAVN